MINSRIPLGLVLSLVISLILVLPGPVLAERPADFGQQWVRSHPYTISGWSNLNTDPALFSQAGLNVILSPGKGTGGETIIANHTAAGYYPWDLNLATKSLTEAVKENANPKNGGEVHHRSVIH